MRKSNILCQLPVCEKCFTKFKSEYEDFSQNDLISDFSFEDFLNTHIEERLRNLNMMWEDLDLTENQREKLGIMYDGFMTYRKGYFRNEIHYKHFLESYCKNDIICCKCCRIRKSQMLTVDHLNNNQILCYNCNIGSSLNGNVCPHQSCPNTADKGYWTVDYSNVKLSERKYGLNYLIRTMRKEGFVVDNYKEKQILIISFKDNHNN